MDGTETHYGSAATILLALKASLSSKLVKRGAEYLLPDLMQHILDQIYSY